MTGLLAVALPVLAYIGLTRGHRPLYVGLEIAPVATCLAIGWFARYRRAAALGITIGLMLGSAVTVHFLNGLIEAHFSYFVMLLFVSLYQDWWSYIAALGTVVAHHVLGVFLPAAVYDHPEAIADPALWGIIHLSFIGMLAIGIVILWKMTESEQTRSRQYYQKLYEAERGVAEQLREAERLKSELISLVSHEFRTPLTSILGFAQTLSARLADFDQSSALLCAERIERQAKRLSRLIHNLLSASGDVRLEPGESTDLHEVVGEIVEELADNRPGAHLRIDAAVPRGLRAAIGTDCAHQIAINLIDNALKFADPGTPIQLRGRLLQDCAVLEVANIGTPIPPEARERIFQPFVQLDSSDTRHFEGIGLGLSIVRKLVQSHQGTVEVRSDGRLVVFRVTMPIPCTGGGHGAGSLRAVDPVQAIAH
ncbi:MAG: sensor histidine kinase [Burkholderiales bacterium]